MTIHYALADTATVKTIDEQTLQDGVAKASSIYQFRSPATLTNLKQFAKSLAEDRELLRTTWSVPSSEVCLTVGAIRKLMFPLQDLTTATVQSGFDIAASGGVRELVADQYRKAALDLNNEALIGSFGIGKIIAALVRPDSNSGDRYCYPPAKIADLKRRILFVMGRIQFTIERYVELDEMRPWFAKNRVFDAVFSMLSVVGSFAISLAMWAGKIVNTTSDLIDKTAQAVDLAIKIGIVGAGVWVYLNYFQEGTGHNARR